MLFFTFTTIPIKHNLAIIMMILSFLIAFLFSLSFLIQNHVWAHLRVQSDDYDHPVLQSFLVPSRGGIDQPERREGLLLPSQQPPLTITINSTSITPYLKLDASNWSNRTDLNTFQYTTCRKGASASLRWFGNDLKCDASSSMVQWEESHGQISIKPLSFHSKTKEQLQPNISCTPSSEQHLPSNWHEFKITNPSLESCLTIVHTSSPHDHLLKPILESFKFIWKKKSSARSTIKRKRALDDSGNTNWTLEQRGNTGVSAMQLTVVSDKHALILDKVEKNPLKIDGQPAWGALYNLDTDEVTALSMKSNSFCAGGSFLGNGTLVNLGGNPPHSDRNIFQDSDGLQSIRFYTPCDQGQKCPIREYDSIKLTTPRWYPTSIRLPDGSVMIVGGCKEGAFRNSARINNPTIEYFPPKTFGFASRWPIYSPFLNRTLITNLFPIVISLPMSDTVFMAANNDAMLYNWKTNKERPLPAIPNGVRITYPFTGSGLLLPLSYKDGYTPEVLICGGTNLDDRLPVTALKASDPASPQCVRMVLTESGISKGWKVEQMPSARIMPDLIMMPDGKVLIVNGAKTGVAGYGNLDDRVGESNADNPNFTPVLYDPLGPEGGRFRTRGMPTSNIARLYHSTATLTPSGKIMIAGSNPNPDFTTKKYRTEYRVEWLNPPYLSSNSRPTIINLAKIADYKETITVQIRSPQSLSNRSVQGVLLDFGFVTHSVHMNSRLVNLKTTISTKGISVEMPPSAEIYPPGYAWLHILIDGIPSPGKRLMIGSGSLSSSPSPSLSLSPFN